MIYSWDASSIIHFWANYPIKNQNFINLWDAFAERIKNKDFVISEVAYDEIKDKIKNFINWLKDKNVNFEIHEKEVVDLKTIIEIKDSLEIQEENYSKGVGENDLFIIAIAKRNNTILITEEAIQNNLPSKKSNYKMPLVCKEIVNVECINVKKLLDLGFP